jgi:superfamily I DNA/RNA helicase
MPKLNSYQEAIAANMALREGPHVRVPAVAGAGKSQVVASSLARIFSQEILQPSDVIVTTFTRVGAQEIADRIKQEAPGVNLTALRVNTFHSICGQWLRTAKGASWMPPHQWGRKFNIDGDQTEKGQRPLDPREARRQFDAAIKAGQRSTPRRSWLNNAILGYKPIPWLNNAMGLSKELERRGVNSDRHSEYGTMLTLVAAEGFDEGPWDPRAAEWLRAADEVLPLFSEYWKGMEQSKDVLGAYDFTDILLYHARYATDTAKLVIVDEAQDTNRLQWRIAKGWVTRGNGRLVVVGDTRQSIFSFQGASPELFIAADESAGFITLSIPTNYRSWSRIVEVSNAVQYDVHTGKKATWAVGEDAISARANPDGSKEPGVVELLNGPDPAELVRQSVQSRVDQGTHTYGDFAILTRTRIAGLAYELAMVRAGVPVCRVSKKKGESLMDMPPSLALFGVLDANRPFDATANKREAAKVLEAFIECLKKRDIARNNRYGLRYKVGADSEAAIQEALVEATSIYSAWLALLKNRAFFTVERDGRYRTEWVEAYRDLLDLMTRVAVDTPLVDRARTVAGFFDPQFTPRYANDERILSSEEPEDRGRANTKYQPDPEDEADDEEDAHDRLEAAASASDRPTDYDLYRTLVDLCKKYNSAPEIRQFARLLAEGIVEVVESDKEVDESEKQRLEEAKKNRVIIATCHAFKGKQAKTCFIPMTKGQYPSLRATSKAALEEERRLFYVAVSRPTDELLFVYSGPRPGWIIDYVEPLIQKWRKEREPAVAPPDDPDEPDEPASPDQSAQPAPPPLTFVEWLATQRLPKGVTIPMVLAAQAEIEAASPEAVSPEAVSPEAPQGRTPVSIYLDPGVTWDIMVGVLSQASQVARSLPKWVSLGSTKTQAHKLLTGTLLMSTNRGGDTSTYTLYRLTTDGKDPKLVELTSATIAPGRDHTGWYRTQDAAVTDTLAIWRSDELLEYLDEYEVTPEDRPCFRALYEIGGGFASDTRFMYQHGRVVTTRNTPIPQCTIALLERYAGLIELAPKIDGLPTYKWA